MPLTRMNSHRGPRPYNARFARVPSRAPRVVQERREDERPNDLLERIARLEALVSATGQRASSSSADRATTEQALAPGVALITGTRLAAAQNQMLVDGSAVATDYEALDNHTNFLGPLVQHTNENALVSGPGMFDSVTEGPLARPYLPPADEAFALLQEFLHDFNSKIPLIAPEHIYALMRDCYAGAVEDSHPAWVLTYMAIGIAHRLRAMSIFQVPDDMSQADWYLNKCLARLPALIMQEPSIQLVQAVLGIAILVQTSSRSDKAAIYVSMALHLMQTLGYHDTATRSDTPLQEREEKYVFWIAFFMDTDMSLSSMRQGTQKLSDIGVSLPDNRNQDWWSECHCSVGPGVNIFALHTGLAVIQAEALERLFSVKSRQLTDTVLEGTYMEILDRLQAWRQLNVDMAVQEVFKSMFRSDVVHLIILEAAYFRTLYQLHAARLLGGLGSRLDTLSSDSLRAIVKLDDGYCYVDAKRLLELCALVSGTHISTTWISVQATLAALCTVLGPHCRKRRSSPSLAEGNAVAADLSLCEESLSRLELATAQVEDPPWGPAVAVCLEMLEQAKAHASGKH
ncbi:hypothetical protein LTR56_008320 [Elasticomyces elasticus]|nr:hypothetical protein LTR56_008320 [Elasticomyces elasticus]KAK3661457.1 hypothetical protein LTR22_007466 [Elasticomyces elasticus]KAK4926186.1 hypothetical protein LTR49_006891 [Elasticomyces elasticus]KAK5750274.1 hypothetical protein LTS12_019691 [Elasticomyces elasticus]